MTLNSTGLGVGTPPANDKILSLASMGILLSGATSDFNFRNSGGTAIQRLRYTDATGALTIGSATGTAYPVELGGNTTTRAVTIDASSNVGIGVTPSAWSSDLRALQVSSSGSYLSSYISGATVNQWLFIGNNAFYDTVDSRWEYIRSKPSAQYIQYNNEHQWLRDTETWYAIMKEATTLYGRDGWRGQPRVKRKLEKFAWERNRPENHVWFEVPEVPSVPLVPEEPLVPLDPLIPLVPDEPELPEVPDEPLPPEAPSRFTIHCVKVEVPTTNPVATKVSVLVPELYETTSASK